MAVRVRKPWVAVVSLVCIALLASGCSLRPLLGNVSVEPATISPNADGADDATNIQYRLGRSADVSIYFENEQGKRYYFRQDQLRSPGEYGVAWGGVINQPEIVDNGYGPQQIRGQVLPDGVYRWTVEATDKRGKTDSVSGTIMLQERRNRASRVAELHGRAAGLPTKPGWSAR